MAHKFSPAGSGGTAPFVSYYTGLPGSPSDSTIYYMISGRSFTAGTATKADYDRICPITGTLTKLYGIIDVEATLGSTENVTLQIRVNNVVQSSTTVKFNVATQNVALTGLSIAITAGDAISISFSCPAWATNPTNVSWSGSFQVD